MINFRDTPIEAFSSLPRDNLMSIHSQTLKARYKVSKRLVKHYFINKEIFFSPNVQNEISRMTFRNENAIIPTSQLINLAKAIKASSNKFPTHAVNPFIDIIPTQSIEGTNEQNES